MHPDSDSQILAGRYRRGLAAIMVILMIVARIVALESDAYPSLSWSSALLTDEGFYIHNARNAVLFGASRTDGFNNMLIMPVLHLCQLGVFRTFGVGAIQARGISVAFSLLALPLFYTAVKKAFNAWTAMLATLFLGLDHVKFLYDRLALMDAPASSVLIASFWFWIYGRQSKGWRQSGCYFCSGLSLLIAYGIRGLVAPLIAVPVVTMFVRLGEAGTSSGRIRPVLRDRLANLWATWPIAAGSGTGAIVYFLFWYLPNRSEIQRVNRYYLGQLKPQSATELAHNIQISLLGEGRGIVPYLLHHTPVVALLSLFGCMLSCSQKSKLPTDQFVEPDANVTCSLTDIGRDASMYCFVWIVILFTILSLTNYSPSRYYVLMYPPMSILAASALGNIRTVLPIICSKRVFLSGITGLVAYHLAATVLEHHSATFTPNEDGPLAIGVFAALSAFCYLRYAYSNARWPAKQPAAFTSGRVEMVLVAAWLLINSCWTIDWLTHITYRQKAADRWIEKNLPADSIVFGAVAPGLCLNNHCRVTSMISGLCNDKDPINVPTSNHKYLAILDDNEWKETWWFDHYPLALGSNHRVATFSHMLRPRFTISIYDVGTDRLRSVWR